MALSQEAIIAIIAVFLAVPSCITIFWGLYKERNSTLNQYSAFCLLDLSSFGHTKLTPNLEGPAMPTGNKVPGLGSHPARTSSCEAQQRMQIAMSLALLSSPTELSQGRGTLRLFSNIYRKI